MFRYLYTNDMRISELPNAIQRVANILMSGQEPYQVDKSFGNNGSTIAFYFNLQKNTETLAVGTTDALFCIRNFIRKFQFPNTRTKDSLLSCCEDKILFAPFRAIVAVLNEMMAQQEESWLTYDEILYFFFCNASVCQNPLFSVKKLTTNIIRGRQQNKEYSDSIRLVLSWKQYERQLREMIKVLEYSSQCFTCRNKTVYFTLKEEDQGFIDSIIDYNKFWYPSNISDFELTEEEYTNYMDTAKTPYNVIDFDIHTQSQKINNSTSIEYKQYLTAIRTKPFLLLAGISGTGKSRIVRQLARACDTIDENPKTVQKPANFEMVQVKPNWHDSSELLGYVSRIEGEKYIAGDFLKFVARAWENNKEISGEDASVPFFLCLDEMNLAPVEQYFAEYLSVIESRKLNDEGEIVSDPIIRKESEQWYYDLVQTITDDDDLRKKFKTEGITIPNNLIVIGTVNMDETTYSFSRKVLDRAMTIEMNEVNLLGGLTDESYDDMGTIIPEQILADSVEGKDVYAGNEDVCNRVIKNYLQPVNDVLEGTPFKIAYRTRNEFLLYVINSIRLNSDKEPNGVIVKALDEVTGMKILSRIEGDETKVSKAFLEKIKAAITDGFKSFVDAVYVDKKKDEDKEQNKVYSTSLSKLRSMGDKLDTGYTSFWD